MFLIASLVLDLEVKDISSRNIVRLSFSYFISLKDYFRAACNLISVIAGQGAADLVGSFFGLTFVNFFFVLVLL